MIPPAKRGGFFFALNRLRMDSNIDPSPGLENAQVPRVAIQGIRASFHDEAARKYFQGNCLTVECVSFCQTFDALKAGNADFVVMAIENSIAGSLLPNYSLLQEFDFQICGEITLPIQLHLLALPGVRFEDVRFVQSHPIAIRQCVDFFQEYPQLQILEKNDTAACAKEIREKNLTDTVAIANLEAATLYELNILERRIETNKKNFTRFLILAKTNIASHDGNKASLVFQVSDDTGSLARVLNIFADFELNLSKIQSMPVPGKPNRYNFYVDLTWSKPQAFQTSLAKVLSFTSNLTVMGIYKQKPF